MDIAIFIFILIAIYGIYNTMQSDVINKIEKLESLVNKHDKIELKTKVKDNELDLEEFKALVKEEYKINNEDNIIALFNSIDKNKSNKVNIEEIGVLHTISSIFSYYVNNIYLCGTAFLISFLLLNPFSNKAISNNDPILKILKMILIFMIINLICLFYNICYYPVGILYNIIKIILNIWIFGYGYLCKLIYVFFIIFIVAAIAK